MSRVQFGKQRIREMCPSLCFICNGAGHTPTECGLRVSANELMRLCSRRCINCFRIGHRSFNCFNRKSCSKCKREHKHHARLCDYLIDRALDKISPTVVPYGMLVPGSECYAGCVEKLLNNLPLLEPNVPSGVRNYGQDNVIISEKVVPDDKVEVVRRVSYPRYKTRVFTNSNRKFKSRSQPSDRRSVDVKPVYAKSVSDKLEGEHAKPSRAVKSSVDTTPIVHSVEFKDREEEEEKVVYVDKPEETVVDVHEPEETVVVADELLKQEDSVDCSQMQDCSKISADNNRTPELETVQGFVMTHIVKSDVKENVLLPTAVIAVQGNAGEIYKARLLLDSGSTHSYIKKSAVRHVCCQKIGSQNLKISTFGTTTVQESVGDLLEVKFLGLDGPIWVSLYAVNNLCGNLRGHPLKAEYIEEISHVGLADLQAIAEDILEVDMLIGMDSLWRFLKPEMRETSFGPVLWNSVAGWVIAGGIKESALLFGTVKEVSTNFNIMDDTAEVVEEDYLEKFWALSHLGIIEDQEVSPILADFNKDIKHSEETKRYMVKLPWRVGFQSRLKDNFGNCVVRMNSLLRKFEDPNNAAFTDEYYGIIEDQLSQGILEDVTTSGRFGRSIKDIRKMSLRFYIPHHGVYKKEVGSSLRIVSDASSHEEKSPSLNECLHQGPSLINDIFDVLVRFRENKVGLVADISKAFLMVEIDPVDRDFLRFLWVTREGEKKEYRFCRAPFGVSSSPFLLNATLRHHFEKTVVDDVDFLKLLNQSFYVDDLISGGNSEEEVINLAGRVVSVLKEAGMKMHKFNSNHEGVRNTLGVEDKDETKVLGIVWNIKEDTLAINVDRISAEMSNSLTKRELLKVVGQVYDPVGWVEPFILLPKLLFQEVSGKNLKWDDKLPEGVMERWVAWKEQIPDLKEIKIPRMIVPCQYDRLELHGFGDASSKAYATCVYLVSISGNVRTAHLLGSKSRVAPLKMKKSIPRLELLGALCLAKFMSVIIKCHSNLTIDNIVYYSDSMNVLHWVPTPYKVWNPYVGNRVRRINELSDPSSWKHVRTKYNPADLPSRGLTVKDLLNNYLWFHGPEFLVDTSKVASDMVVGSPVAPTPECIVEKRKVVNYVNVALLEKPLFELEKFSSLSRLISVTALVIKMQYKAKIVKSRFRGDIESENAYKAIYEDTQILRNKALQYWVKLEQMKHCPDEWKFCKNNPRRLPSGMKVPCLVRQWNLSMDSADMLRCHTRLQYANLDYGAVEPMFLPNKSHLTQLYLQSLHLRLHHAGAAALHVAAREEFGIVRGRQLCRALVNKCVSCRRVSANTFPRLDPPNMPAYRVREADPFNSIGVDYCGPFRIKSGGVMHNQAYVMIITCAVSRAVHFEISLSLNVPSTILALRRFMARRGVPANIVSDNFGSFKRIGQEFRAILSSTAMQKYLNDHRINWTFYVSRAARRGGWIERIVGIYKRALKRVIGGTALPYVEFETLTCEIEAIINCRPISYVYSNIDEGIPITPSLLLCGKNIIQLPTVAGYRIDGTKSQICTTRLRYLEKIKDYFWTRFKTEYLQLLADRHRWDRRSSHGRQPKVNEMVLLKSDNVLRANWRLARIEKVFPGEDGVVRTCELRMPECPGSRKFTRLSRPAELLVPLECDEVVNLNTAIQNELNAERERTQNV